MLESRTRARRTLLLLAWLLVGGALVEAGLRVGGATPWQQPVVPFVITPDGWAEADERTGWALRPGVFEYTFGDGYSQHATHDARGHRATPEGAGPLVELHGGSFAYGLGLADEDTMGWRLQGLLPEHDVRNRAAPGHGPVQAWLALDEHARLGTAPSAMVVTYAAFHDQRVTVNRSWRRALVGPRTGHGIDPQTLPAVRSRRGAPVVRAVGAELAPLPGARRSAAVARLDLLADVLDEWRRGSTAVTRSLLVELWRRGEQLGTRVVVVGLADDPRTRATLQRCGELGVPTLDAGLDWTDPRWQLQPHDHHPNARAAERWATAVAELVAGLDHR